MAIKSLETGIYYKLDYKESYVKNNYVQVAMKQYKNEGERLKEKSREEEQNKFIENLNNARYSLYEKGEENNPYEYFGNIYNYFSIIEYQGIPNYDNIDFSIIEKLGFKREWVENPIIFTGSFIMNCGRFDDCAITQEYLYNKIKSNMVNVIDC
jgi:hypothetical protein